MTKRKPKNPKKNYLINIFLFLNVLLVGLFFFQFSTYMSENYEIGQDIEKAKTLSLNNESLGKNLFQVNHLKNLESLARELNFEKPEKIHYVKAPTTSVAAK